MPVNYPKFDKKIQEQIDNSNIKTAKTRPGTIVNYDKVTNTATVLVDEQHAGGIGNVVALVPCPVTRGVQSVAPTIGTRCLVGFRDNAESDPYLINYFDDTASKTNYHYNYTVRTGIPRYMVH